MFASPSQGLKLTLPIAFEPVPPGLPALVGPVLLPHQSDRGGEQPGGLVVLHADGVAREAVVVGRQGRGVVRSRADQNAGGRVADRAVGDGGGTTVLDRNADVVAGDGDAAGREVATVDVDVRSSCWRRPRSSRRS